MQKNLATEQLQELQEKESRMIERFKTFADEIGALKLENHQMKEGTRNDKLALIDKNKQIEKLETELVKA